MNNILTIRQKKIINILKDTKDTISSNALADDLNCSNKTVQLEIKSINSILKKVKIESLRGLGYILSGDLSELENIRFEYDGYNLNRMSYILRKIILLYNGDSLKVESLANELYVSLSTVKNDLKDVKCILKDYNLNIISKYKLGIGIAGETKDFIKCILDIVIKYRDIKIEDFFSDFVKNNMDIIRYEFLKGLKNEDIICTDYGFKSMCNYVFLYLSIESDINYKEYITKYINKYKDILNKKNDEIIKTQILKSIDNFIVNLKNITYVDFNNDNIFKECLCKHLINLFIKRDLNIKINDTNYDDIKINFPFAFDLAKVAKMTLEKELDIDIDEGEVGNIALHIGGALQRKSNKYKDKNLKTIIVCTSGIGTSMIIKAKLEDKFEDRLKVLKVIPSYLVDSIDLSDIDFLIATVPINIKNIPIIRISPFLDDKEINLIEKFLCTEKVCYNLDFSEIFSNDLFFINLDFDNKYDVIEYMSSKLLEQNYIDEEMKKSYIERERIATTEIGNMVAIPHGAHGKAFENKIAIGILKNSINWEVGKVRFVMMLALQRDSILNYEDLFSNIYKRIDSVAKVISICESKRYEKFISMFK